MCTSPRVNEYYKRPTKKKKSQITLPLPFHVPEARNQHQLYLQSSNQFSLSNTAISLWLIHTANFGSIVPAALPSPVNMCSGSSIPHLM